VVLQPTSIAIFGGNLVLGRIYEKIKVYEHKLKNLTFSNQFLNKKNSIFKLS
jgi:hypothetical protein